MSSSFLARLFWAGVALLSLAPTVALIVNDFMAALSTSVIDGTFHCDFCPWYAASFYGQDVFSLNVCRRGELGASHADLAEEYCGCSKSGHLAGV